MLETPALPRSTFWEQPEGLRISIPPTREPSLATFFPIWLTLWTYGGATFAYRFWQGSERNLFSFLWLCCWVSFTPVAAYHFAFSLPGSDVVLVRPDQAHRAELLGLARTRSSWVPDMRNLRFVPESGGGRSRRTSYIAFDYGAKTIRSAQGTDEAEGNLIIERILQPARITTLPSYTERC